MKELKTDNIFLQIKTSPEEKKKKKKKKQHSMNLK